MNDRADREIELRKSPRRRVLKGGKILMGVQHAIIDCTVRNTSDGGMRIRLSDITYVPAEFILYVPVDQVCYRVHVRHRDGTDIGVEIVERIEKPSWYRI